MSLHSVLRTWREAHGGKWMYAESGTGEMIYEFRDNLFVRNMIVRWNEFNPSRTFNQELID